MKKINRTTSSSVFCLVLGLTIVSTPPARSNETTNSAQNKTSTPIEQAASTEDATLSTIEAKLFQHSYSSELTEERLFRIEKLVFGNRSSGKTGDRIERIESALKFQTTISSQANVETEKSPPQTLNAQESFAQAMRNGKAEFNIQRYHSAQEHFEKAIAASPNSAAAYAHLGDTLLRLQDRAGAREAYKACFRADPFGEYAAYAKNYLLMLTNEQAYNKTAPQDTPITVERTIRTINNQADDAHRRHISHGEIHANHRLRLGEIEADLILGLHPQRNRRQSVYDPFYVYDPNDRTDISNLAQIRTSYIRSDSRVQANRVRVEAAKRAALVQESAANLKELLLQPAKPGEAKLRAMGTNLYVRYYGDDVPSSNDSLVPLDPPPTELHAQAEKLSLTQKR